MPNVTETFNTADSSTLGPNLTWTEFGMLPSSTGAHLQVVGNAARVDALNVYALATCSEQTAGKPKLMTITVKTFNTPASGTTWVVAGENTSNGFYGAWLGLDSAGVCTVYYAYVSDTGFWVPVPTPRVITKPTTPFDLSFGFDRQAVAAFQIKLNNEILMNYRPEGFSGVSVGFGINVSSGGAVGDVEIDSFTSIDSPASQVVPYLIEDFNKADSTNIGATSYWDGNTNFQVVGNAARAVTAGTVSEAHSQLVYDTSQKATELTVKTFANPSSGSNHVYAFIGLGTDWYAGRISVTNAGVCTVEFGTLNGTTWTSKGGLSGASGATTITKPTAPFTFRCQYDGASATRASLYVNGTFVAYGNATGANVGWGAFGLFANSNVADVEIDQVRFDFNVLQRSTGGIGWPADGRHYGGPFISSTGNVYTFGISGANVYPSKAVDPTLSGFVLQTAWLTETSATVRSMDVTQVGDILHVAASVNNSGVTQTNVYYRAWNMATDAWVATALQAHTAAVSVSNSVAVAKRSTGSDVIVFYNTTGFTNMGKTYQRIAARRSAGGTGAFGTETQIGLAIGTTDLQSECVDSVCLGSSDRVHLFWTKTNLTAAAASSLMHRCVKSTDNLGGTQPATAAAAITATGPVNASVVDTHHAMGQAFCSAAGLLLMQAGTSVWTATSADTPTWTQTSSVLAAAPLSGTYGGTTYSLRSGGTPFDVADQYVTWVDNTSGDPMWDDKPSGGAFGTDVALHNGTTAQITSNVFQRGNNIVLAMVYDSSSQFMYDEVFIRTVGGPTTIGPVGVVAATATVRTVTISIPTAIAPAKVSATATVQPVTIAVGFVIAVSTVVATATVRTVAVNAVTIQSPTPVAATATVQSVSVLAVAKPTPSIVAATATVQPVTISATGVPVLTAVSATATVQAITIAASAAFAVSTVAATATVRTITPLAVVVTAPNTVAATATVQSVTIDTVATGGDQDVPVTTIVATATVQPLTITAVPTVQPNTVAATATVQSVTISTVQPLVLTPVAATATVRTITLVTPSNVPVSTVVATSTVQPITPLAVAKPTPTTVAATATVQSVTVLTVSAPVLAVVVATATVPSVTLVTPSNVSVSTIAATATVPQVIVQAGAGLTVPVATVVATGAVPAITISSSTGVPVNTVAATATVQSVTAVQITAISVATVVATATVQSVVPSVAGPTTVSVATVGATASLPSLTISTSANVVVVTVVASATIPSVGLAALTVAPTLTVAATATVRAVAVQTIAAPAVGTPVAAVATVQAVTVKHTAITALSPVTAAASVPSVVIQTSGTTTVPVTTVVATASVPSLTITALPIVAPLTVSATASVQAISIQATATFLLGRAIAAAAVQSPSISTSATVTIGTIAALATVRAPGLVTPVIVTPTHVVAYATVHTVGIAGALPTMQPVAAIATVHNVVIVLFGITRATAHAYLVDEATAGAFLRETAQSAAQMLDTAAVEV